MPGHRAPPPKAEVGNLRAGMNPECSCCSSQLMSEPRQAPVPFSREYYQASADHWKEKTLRHERVAQRQEQLAGKAYEKYLEWEQNNKRTLRRPTRRPFSPVTTGRSRRRRSKRKVSSRTTRARMTVVPAAIVWCGMACAGGNFTYC